MNPDGTEQPPSRFTPDEETARSLVAAANQRSEELAQRLVAVRRYALDKGDRQLAAIIAIRTPELLSNAPRKEGQ